MIKKSLYFIKSIMMEYGWSAWIGFGIGYFFKIGLEDWRWWAFSIPLIILVGVSKSHKSWKLKSIIDKKIDQASISNGSFFVGNPTPTRKN